MDAPEFSERLGTFLANARAELGARLVALAELSVASGQMAPSWRVVAGGTAPLRELELHEFERFASKDARGTRLLAHDEGLAWFGAAGTVDVLPLDVVPKISAGHDALLFVVHGDPIAADALLREFRATLEQGLSKDRRVRIASVVFAAVERNADAIELTDRDGRLFYVNPAWERFSGYSAAEALGRTAAEVFRDPEAPLHDAAFYQFTMAELHAGKSWMGAISGRSRQGRRLFYEVNVAPFSAAGFVGHVAVRRDLAHRSERDEALALAHHEFRSVLAAIPDGAVVLRDGRIYFANAAFQATVRETERGVIGRPYDDFVHPEDREQFAREHRTRVTRVRLVPAEGPPRVVEVSTAGEVSFEGKPAMILLSRDMTDDQLASEELSRTEKLSALGALSAGVAHELNNPLAYVALNLDLLKERAFETLPPAAREVLDEAIGGVSRMRNIASELRVFSGKEGPGPAEPVDVTRALTSALNMTQNDIRHRARLVRDLEDGLSVLAREGQLVQVLVNVLVNAAHAIDASSGDDQVIRVSSRGTPDSFVEIVISDTGVGIPQNMLARVFDPFTTSKLRGEGSGLGLAICRRIIRGFGGEIGLESTVGKGTRVVIVLPRTLEKRSSEIGRSYAPASTPSLRILIVDDEGSIGRALKRSLSNHDVTLCEDGAGALLRLEEDSDYDIVLCDLMMPHLPGSEFYAKACQQRPKLAGRFVFMTGGAVTPAVREFSQTIGSNVLWKPFELADVEAAVERVVRSAGPIRRASTPPGPPSNDGAENSANRRSYSTIESTTRKGVAEK